MKEKKKNTNLDFSKQNIYELNDDKHSLIKRMGGSTSVFLTVGLIIAVTKKVHITIYEI